MNPHDHDLITSLYDYEDGFASSYSTSFHEELESYTSDEELKLPSFEGVEEEVDPVMYCFGQVFCIHKRYI